MRLTKELVESGQTGAHPLRQSAADRRVTVTAEETERNADITDSTPLYCQTYQTTATAELTWQYYNDHKEAQHIMERTNQAHCVRVLNTGLQTAVTVSYTCNT